MRQSTVKKLSDSPSFKLSGTRLTRLAWVMEPTAFTIDFKTHMDLIRNVASQEPFVLLIEGATGSGKTLLANALHLSGERTQLIDLSLYRREKTLSKVSFNLNSTTFVIDELHGTEPAAFYEVIDELRIANRKSIVMFTQSFQGLNVKFRYPVKRLKLTRKGLA